MLKDYSNKKTLMATKLDEVLDEQSFYLTF